MAKSVSEVVRTRRRNNISCLIDELLLIWIPHFVMAMLPKRIIKETERLVVEPYDTPALLLQFASFTWPVGRADGDR